MAVRPKRNLDELGNSIMLQTNDHWLFDLATGQDEYLTRLQSLESVDKTILEWWAKESIQAQYRLAAIEWLRDLNAQRGR